MTDTQVPASIRAAILRQAKRKAPLHGPASIGSLCFALDTEGEKHLVWVKEVHGDFAVVCAAHTMPELAGPYDVILRPETTALSYPVVVQTDVIGGVWHAQLGTLLAILPTSADERLRAVADGDREGDGMIFGGILDRRWHFKTEETDRLHNLCADATLDAWAFYDQQMQQ